VVFVNGIQYAVARKKLWFSKYIWINASCV